MTLARTLITSGVLFLLACSSGKSGVSPPRGDDGGNDGGGPVFTFSPQGCAYSVAPPSTRAYTDFAPDDTAVTASAPARVRVGLGGNGTKGQPGYADPTTSAAFTWETSDATHAAKVKMGTLPDALSDVHAGFSWTTLAAIGTQNLCMHEVHVCGLKPGTTYYYAVGGGPPGGEVWSATQSFSTVPASGKITVGILGDARDNKDTWQAVHLRMRDAGVALQLIGGDVVDAGAIEDLYTQWLDAIWKDPKDATKFLTLGQQMILPIAGNHENEASQFYANFAIPGDGPYAEQFASFDVGNTHIVLFDDQPVAAALAGGQQSDASSAELAWLDKDLSLANADRTAHPFLVVVSHRGLFSTSNHAVDGDVLATRGALAPVFDKYNVDLAINGHDHEYERSKPLKAGSKPSGDPVVGAGTQYIICAGAGADPYAVGSSQASFSAKTQPFGKNTPYTGVYGLMTLEAKSLTLDIYGLKAGGSTVASDDKIDTITLTK
jgi:hypothetical protein